MHASRKHVPLPGSRQHKGCRHGGNILRGIRKLGPLPVRAPDIQPRHSSLFGSCGVRRLLCTTVSRRYDFVRFSWWIRITQCVEGRVDLHARVLKSQLSFSMLASFRAAITSKQQPHARSLCTQQQPTARAEALPAKSMPR